jgi:FkbM family methyltransferase
MNQFQQYAKRYILNNKFLAKKFGKVYFGLNQLDLKLSEFIDCEDGYFIELGANDGISQSNTKNLELYHGWQGLLIEPSPQQFGKLIKNRKKRNSFFMCACVAFDFPDKKIALMYSNLMTVALKGRNDILNVKAHALDGEKYSQKEKSFKFEAIAKTLQSLIDEAGSPQMIDLLSLDVEGGEIEVLRGVDFGKTHFKLILIETRSIVEVTKFLRSKKYKQIAQLSHHDYLFAPSSALEANMTWLTPA